MSHFKLFLLIGAVSLSHSAIAAPTLTGDLKVQPFWLQTIKYNWAFVMKTADQLSIPLGTTVAPGFSVTFTKTQATEMSAEQSSMGQTPRPQKTEERGVEAQVCLVNPGNRTVQINGLAASFTGSDQVETDAVATSDSQDRFGGFGSILPRQTKCSTIEITTEGLTPGERYSVRVRVAYGEKSVKSFLELSGLIQFPLLPKIKLVDATATFHGITKSDSIGYKITQFGGFEGAVITHSGLQFAFQWVAENIGARCGSRTPVVFSAYLETSDTHTILPAQHTTVLSSGSCAH